MNEFELICSKNEKGLVDLVITPWNSNGAQVEHAEKWAGLYMKAGYSKIKITGDEKSFLVDYAEY